VYYKRADVSPPGIAALRTDIAGFVGIARRGPPDVPVAVGSWRQFQAVFGDFTGAGYLAYAVRAFFENGGRKCWVVRVSPPSAAAAGTLVRSEAAGADPVWLVRASSPGVWGNDLEVAWREAHAAQTVGLASGQVAAWSTAVASVHGFVRGSLARISQRGATAVLKVVSQVDAIAGRLIWIADDPAQRLPYDAPLSGFAPDAPVRVESVAYTLLVRQLGRLVASYDGLSLVPEHPSYGPAVLEAGSAATQDVPGWVVIEELREVAALPARGFAPIDTTGGSWTVLTGGLDALAELGVDDFIGEDLDPLDDDLVRAQKQRGLRALETIDEVSIVAVPDIQIRPYEPPLRVTPPPCLPDPCLPPPPPLPAPAPAPTVGDLPPVFTGDQIFQVQATLVARCEALRDRFALLDPPFSAAADGALGSGAVRAWRRRFDSSYAALYYPWARVVDPVRLAAGGGAGLTRDIPPCGHVAGLYASTDWAEGVHKAPSNTALSWIQDVTAAVDEPTHGVLNGEGVNVIRALSGRGLRVLGARTVSGDASWRFVNVRRLLIMIETAIALSTRWAVFEPNDAMTRSKLRLSLTSFLLGLWHRGALMGGTPAAGFYVRCDATNNPPASVDDGQLVAEVGVAPAQPFEFVVLTVGRVDNEFLVTDTGSR
jgi:hypothetical protein